MAQESSNAMASPKSAPPLTSSKQSMSSTPSSAPSASAGLPAPVNTANVAHVPHHSMALVPVPSQPGTSAAPLTAANVSTAQHPRMNTPHNLQEGEDAWSLVTRSLMVAVMGSQPPATAASTLLGIFKPMVDGWAAAQKEGKRWKERAEMYMAEHHKHRAEFSHKHHTLQAHGERLQQSLAESEGKVRELESQKSTFVAKVSSLEEALGTVEAQASAAKEAHAQEKQQSETEVEATAKSAQEAKLMYENLRQETENRTRSHNADITKIQDRIKEMESVKAKLVERLGSAIAENNSFEQELAQKRQDFTNLQSRVRELNTRKEALERQLVLYQRMPTRRY